MLLANKVACVTGGTRGIGLAIAKAYLAEGATVVICGSRPETAQAAVDKIKAENPDAKVEGMAPDLTSLESVTKAFQDVAARHGSLDILANNAGISDATPLGHYTEETFDGVMDLNVKGVFNCSKAASDIMKEHKSGAIVNVSSMVSIYGQPGGVAYPVSKFAVNGMTLSMARELAAFGIRVNAVAPGITNTDMMQAVPKEMIQGLIATIPLGRIGDPEDIANAAVFLSSDKASYISGVVLSVDGLART